MLDQAFEALKTYDWGTDPKVLAPIDEAVMTTLRQCRRPQGFGRPTGRRPHDRRLTRRQGLRLPQTDVDRHRPIRADLAGLLPDKDLSHMSRYALERIPAAEAGQALRDALTKVSGLNQVGVIGSLGVRRDTASVAGLGGTARQCRRFRGSGRGDRTG